MLQQLDVALPESPVEGPRDAPAPGRAGRRRADPPLGRADEPARTSDGSEVPAELVRAAIAGDRTAVGQLLAVVRPYVVRYCRARMGASRSAVEDVAQEVCLAVLTALPGYRFEKKPFLAFVYGIAAHKVIDAHRAASRVRWDLDVEIPDSVDATEGPEQHALHAELSGELRRLLDELPPKQREILVLRVALGLSAEETAATVGSTAGAVRIAQHRALARLRQAQAHGGTEAEGRVVPPAGRAVASAVV